MDNELLLLNNFVIYYQYQCDLYGSYIYLKPYEDALSTKCPRWEEFKKPHSGLPLAFHFSINNRQLFPKHSAISWKFSLAMSLIWLVIFPTFYITTGNNVAKLLPRSKKDLLYQMMQYSALFELLVYTNMPLTLFDLQLASSSGPSASLPPADSFSHLLLLCKALFSLGY